MSLNTNLPISQFVTGSNGSLASKNDIINYIHEATGQPKKHVKITIEAFEYMVENWLTQDHSHKVRFGHLGTFQSLYRPSRKGVNPQLTAVGKEQGLTADQMRIDIPPQYLLRFVPTQSCRKRFDEYLVDGGPPVLNALEELEQEVLDDDEEMLDLD